MRIDIQGSHGCLRVERETGAIVATVYGCDGKRCDCGYIEGGRAYPQILRFDPATLGGTSPTCADMDILDTGYFYARDGGGEGYEPPVDDVERSLDRHGFTVEEGGACPAFRCLRLPGRCVVVTGLDGGEPSPDSWLICTYEGPEPVGEAFRENGSSEGAIEFQAAIAAAIKVEG